jgi:signal transduction histidine kinase
VVELLDDLLAFSSFEAGKLTLNRTDLDVVPVVADAVSIHEEVAKKHDVVLTLRAEAPSAVVHADVTRLTRLLVNLIGNALKFTPAGGRIDVSVSVIDDECEIAVADTGVGIPKDQLQSIFERFQQVGKPPRRTTGVGLGLYIARLVAEAHGGRVWAESESSAGSTFRFRMPLKDSQSI